MKILSIESATKTLSVALAEENKILALATSDNKATHSETLLPLIEQMLAERNESLSEVDAIAVSNGPGSFTGLRIGVTTAKGLGLALDRPVIAVPTLDAMAYNFVSEEGALICPMIDARRNQIFTGAYKTDGSNIRAVMNSRALDIDELIEEIRNLQEEKIIFLGDGAEFHRDKLVEAFGDAAIVASGEKAHPSAGSVALLGEAMMKLGEAMSADDVVPTYLRQSQAEREYAAVTSIGKKIISRTLDADNEGKVFESADTEADIKAIADLESAVFGGGAWTIDMVKGHFSNPCNGALVARRRGGPCGYVLFTKIAGEGEVFRVGVSESYRRAGIARRLLGVLLQDSETDAWMLEVRYGNAPAIALYEAMGFVRERVIQDYYSNPLEDALDMRRVIRDIED